MVMRKNKLLCQYPDTSGLYRSKKEIWITASRPRAPIKSFCEQTLTFGVSQLVTQNTRVVKQKQSPSGREAFQNYIVFST